MRMGLQGRIIDDVATGRMEQRDGVEQPNRADYDPEPEGQDVS